MLLKEKIKEKLRWQNGEKTYIGRQGKNGMVPAKKRGEPVAAETTEAEPKIDLDLDLPPDLDLTEDLGIDLDLPEDFDKALETEGIAETTEPEAQTEQPVAAEPEGVATEPAVAEDKPKKEIETPSLIDVGDISQRVMAEEEAKREEAEAKRKAEEEEKKRIQAEEEERKRAEEQARKEAEEREEAKRKAIEEARRKEAEARQKAEEAARIAAEAAREAEEALRELSEVEGTTPPLSVSDPATDQASEVSALGQAQTQNSAKDLGIDLSGITAQSDIGTDTEPELEASEKSQVEDKKTSKKDKKILNKLNKEEKAKKEKIKKPKGPSLAERVGSLGIGTKLATAGVAVKDTVKGAAQKTSDAAAAVQTKVKDTVDDGKKIVLDKKDKMQDARLTKTIERADKAKAKADKKRELAMKKLEEKAELSAKAASLEEEKEKLPQNTEQENKPSAEKSEDVNVDKILSDYTMPASEDEVVETAPGIAVSIDGVKTVQPEEKPAGGNSTEGESKGSSKRSRRSVSRGRKSADTDKEGTEEASNTATPSENSDDENAKKDGEGAKDTAENSSKEGAEAENSAESNSEEDEATQGKKGKKNKKGKKGKGGKGKKKEKKPKKEKKKLTPEEKQALKEAKAEQKKQKKAEKKEKAKEKKALNKEKRKEKKAAKKVRRKEKKAIKKEKRKEKRAKRKAWIASLSKSTKLCFLLGIMIFLVCAGSVGYLYVPPFIESIPQRIEDYKNRPDPEDAEVVEVVEATIEESIVQNDFFERFSLAGTAGVHEETAVFVSPTGDDNNSGSQNSPLRTIQRGIDKLEPGGVLYIREGTYSENIIINKQGSERNYITITSMPDEEVILDGSQTAGVGPLIRLQGAKYITISNLELTNAPRGIEVANSNNIIIAGNRISEIRGGTKPAYAISIENPSKDTIKSILVYYNKIRGIGDGDGAGVHVAGNTEFVNLMGNIITNVKGNGIEYLGNRGICPEPEFDNPRKSTISGNTLKLCINDDDTANGIFIDGARGMSLEDNVVFRCDRGIDVSEKMASEEKYTYNVVVKNNLLACNKKFAISVGGEAEDTVVKDVKIYNNTSINSYSDDTGNDISIKNAYNVNVNYNILYNDKAAGMPIAIETEDMEGRNLSFVNNIYMANTTKDLVKFKYYTTEVTGLDSWATLTKDDYSAYYTGTLEGLCQDSWLGDYSYFLNSKVVGCTILHAAQ